MTPTLQLLVGCAFHPGQSGLGIGDHAVIGDATLATYPGGDIVRCAVTESFEQVRADRDVPVLREAAGELPVELIPARWMVHQHDARVRSGAVGLGDVRMDLVATTAGDRRNAGDHAALGIGPERVPHTVLLMVSRDLDVRVNHWRLAESMVEEYERGVDFFERAPRDPGPRGVRLPDVLEE